MTIEDLADHKQIAIIWSIDDVQTLRPDLNDDQAWEVLQAAEHYHDCEYGFTWHLLKHHADALFHKETKEHEQKSIRAEHF